MSSCSSVRSAQIVAQRQRRGKLPHAPPKPRRRFRRRNTAPALPVKPVQHSGCPAGREQIPAQKRKARPAQPLRRRPEQQKTQPQTAHALARVHGRQPQNLPGRGQISAQHQIDAPDRHEPRQQPQAALRLRQAQRIPRDPRRGKKQPCGRQHARQQHIAEAVRRRALQPGAVAPAVGLGAKAARCDPRPGEPQRRRERRHRQHELHAAQALRADPSGQIRLEQHRKQPQQQRRSGQQ